MRNSILLSATVVASLGLGGCVTNWHSVKVHRPVDQELDQTVTQMWADEVRTVAQEAARDFGFEGDEVRLAIARAGLREGQKIGDLATAVSVAASDRSRSTSISAASGWSVSGSKSVWKLHDDTPMRRRLA